MSEKVITRITPPTEHALIKNTTYSLAQRYRQPLERIDINSPRFGTSRTEWWQHTVLVHGAETGEYYFGRPGTFSKSDARYGRGILLSVFESITTRSATAKLIGPQVPIIEIGQHWDPIDEQVDEVIIQNDFHFEADGQPFNTEIAEMEHDEMLSTVNGLISGTTGFNAWHLNTNFLKGIIAVSDLYQGRIK